MNEIVASNIRFHREQRAWTQELLAQAAHVDPRTVQRAEQGQGTSRETLLAIAGALDVSVELLRLDPREPLAQLLGVSVDEVTPELVARKAEEAKAAFESEYTILEVHRVTCSGDLSRAFEANALLVQCESTDDAVRDLTAELNTELMEMIELAGDLPPAQRRECEKSAFETVERLDQRNCVVSVALQPRALVTGDGGKLRLVTLFVVVSPLSDAKKRAAVKKNLGVSFGW